MIILLLFGLGMAFLGLLMTIRPISFANSIVTFSDKPWFHRFEISSRLLVGGLLWWFAEQSAYPLLMTGLGVLLCFVGVFLMVIGEQRHRQFARLTANIGENFRYIGLLSVLLGLGLSYYAVIT